MTDFLTRLAERTLEVVPVAQPITASMFAKGRTMASSPSEAEGFTVQDEVQVAPEPVMRRDSSRTAPQSPRAIPRANPPYQVPAAPGQPLPRTPESQVAPQPQDPPQFSEHVEAEPPPTMVKGSMLPGVDADSREEQLYAVPRQDTSTKEPKDTRANKSLVGKSLTHGQRSPAPTEQAALPGEQAGRVGEMVQGIHEANTDAIAQQSTTAHEQRVNMPLVGGHVTHRQESLASPIDAPKEHVVLHDTSSATVGETVSLGDRVVGSSRRLEIQTNPKQLVRLDSVQHQSTPTVKRESLLPERQPLLVPDVQQQQGISSQQPTDLVLTNEYSGSRGGNRLQLAASLAQNQQATTSQRSSAPTTEEAASSTPTIRVTIGRIDVRAVTPPVSTARPKPGKTGPTLSLDDYARQRKGGER